LKGFLKKYAKFAVLLLLAVFILWFFGRNLNWEEVRNSLAKADKLQLIMAALCICFGYFLRAMRWRTLLAPITETSISELFAATTVGFAAMFFIGRAAEIVRPMWLPMRDRRVRPSAALVTLGVERICDLAALVGIFSLNLIWFSAPDGRENEFFYVRMAGVLLLAGVIAGIAFLFIFHKFSGPIISRIEKFLNALSFLPVRVRGVVVSILKQLAKSLNIFSNFREVLAVILWTLSLWFAIAVPTWLTINAFGLNFTFGQSLFVLGWAAIGSVVPTPGGAAGAFHAATAGGLIFLGVGQDQAAAVSIAMHLVYFAPAVFFGAFYFLRGDLSMSGLREALSSEHAVDEIEHEK
jgi:glycosyltransferase 2 family protein